MTNPAYSIAPVGTVTRSEVSALTRRVWAALGAPQSDAATLVALRDEVSTALREIDRSGQQAARTISRHAPD
ncbi:MAG TPA: hypothetical protein VK427_22185, partial [Kofleriaceae bacterium]|nr:hypothetical protein [Kofleriaceae bacterium]